MYPNFEAETYISLSDWGPFSAGFLRSQSFSFLPRTYGFSSRRWVEDGRRRRCSKGRVRGLQKVHCSIQKFVVSSQVRRSIRGPRRKN